MPKIRDAKEIIHGIYDAHGSPLVFSVNEAKALKLVSLAKNSGRELLDFGEAIGFTSDEYVTAIEVEQASDSTVFVVVATGNRAARSAARVFIMKPFKPADFSISDKAAIADLVIPQTKKIPGPVDMILIVCCILIFKAVANRGPSIRTRSLEIILMLYLLIKIWLRHRPNPVSSDFRSRISLAGPLKMMSDYQPRLMRYLIYVLES